MAGAIIVAAWFGPKQIEGGLVLLIIPFVLASMADDLVRALPLPPARGRSVQLREIPFLGPTAWGIHFDNRGDPLVVYLAGLAGFATLAAVMAIVFHLSLQSEEAGKYLWALPGGYILRQIWQRLWHRLPAGWLAITPEKIIYQAFRGSATFEVSWSDVKEIQAGSYRGERGIRVIPVRGEDVFAESKFMKDFVDRNALPRGFAYLSSPTAPFGCPGNTLRLNLDSSTRCCAITTNTPRLATSLRTG